MIDYAAQPNVARACARLMTRGGRAGTGYLVAADRIATCHHVVCNVIKGSEPIACEFGDEREKREAFLLDLDPATDAALLRLDRPVAASPLPLLGGPTEGAPDYWAFGYPYFTEGVSVTLHGIITNFHQVSSTKILDTFSLFVEDFQGRVPESVGGLSGSPVLAGPNVIGHLSSVLGASGAMKAPHLAHAYAVRAAGVLRLLGRAPASPSAASAIAALPESTAILSACFREVQQSATAAEVRAALASAPAGADEVRLYAAEVLIGRGEPHDALAILSSVRPSRRGSELEALARSLLGDRARAQAILAGLEGSSESLGIQGGILKRRWLDTRDRSWLEAAQEAYRAAYELEHDAYPAINAAACALYLGRSEDATAMADAVIALLTAKPDRSEWDEASLAEAYLLRSQLDEARRHYAVAAHRQRARPRNLAVMRRQARLDLEHLGKPPDALDDVIPVPRAAAFTGHRIDEDPTLRRFPVEAISRVADAIGRVLDEHHVHLGYSSAASGADLLFLEALLEREGEAHIFLPFPAEHFLRTSVGPIWQARFEAVLERVGPERTVVLSNAPSGDDADLQYARCNEAIQRAALAEAALLDDRALLIAVVAEGEGKIGGTADMVRSWMAHPGAGDVIRIDPSPGEAVGDVLPARPVAAAGEVLR